MEKNADFKSELETQYNILIKAQEQSETRRFIIILAILTITFLSVLVSVAFAFIALKNSKKINNDVSINEKKYYQTLSTIYDNNSTLELNNIVTGYNLPNPKIFQITNEGNTDITFNIKLISINTSLISNNNLLYTLSRDNQTTITKQLPLKDTTLLDNIKISPNETITYTLTANYQGNIDQAETNNYYKASIFIEPIDNKSNLLE